MIQIYDPNKSYTKEKDNVVISHGFMRFGITESIRQIHKNLHDEYNVLIFDNAGHGSNKKLQFTIDNQKKILENISNENIIKNHKNHLIVSCLPGFLTIQNLLVEKEILNNFQSITLVAPVINIKSAIDRNIENLGMSKRIGNIVLQSGLGNLFLKIKGINANAITINKLNNEYEPNGNLKAIISLAEKIPLHVICNSKDSINNNLTDTIGNNIHVELTAKNIDRHHVYFQEGYDYTSLNTHKKDIIIGDTVKKFIDNN